MTCPRLNPVKSYLRVLAHPLVPRWSIETTGVGGWRSRSNSAAYSSGVWYSNELWAHGVVIHSPRQMIRCASSRLVCQFWSKHSSRNSLKLMNAFAPAYLIDKV
jgi:hypothetical protein